MERKAESANRLFSGLAGSSACNFTKEKYLWVWLHAVALSRLHAGLKTFVFLSLYMATTFTLHLLSEGSPRWSLQVLSVFLMLMKIHPGFCGNGSLDCPERLSLGAGEFLETSRLFCGEIVLN